MFAGIHILEDSNMVDYMEDWSSVRSHARARRRRKRGFPQRIKVIAIPKKVAYSIDGGRTIIMHPVMARELRKAVK